jgi:hypothetical protein
MSKGGYNKVLAQLRQSEAKNRDLQTANEVLRLANTAQGTQISELKSKTPKAEESKWRKMYNNSPIWGAIGVVAGIIVTGASAHSRAANLVIAGGYFLFWVVLCVEFIRMKVVETRPLRVFLNSVFCLFMFVALYAGWRITPKVTDQPDVIAELKTAAPWLFIKPNPDQSEGRQQPDLPVPNFRVEPEGQILPIRQPNQEETFMLEAHNLSGADIDHVRFSEDFFVAEVGAGKPMSSVKFRRYFGEGATNLLTAQFIDADDIALPQNNKVLFPVTGTVNVAPGQSGDDSMLLILMRREPGVRKLAGVRIKFTYQRYLDHKPFTYVTAYQYISSDGYRTFSGLSSGTRIYPSQARSELLDISDIKPYAADETKWEDATFGISFTNGKVRRFDADKEK